MTTANNSFEQIKPFEFEDQSFDESTQGIMSRQLMKTEHQKAPTEVESYLSKMP